MSQFFKRSSQTLDINLLTYKYLNKLRSLCVVKSKKIMMDIIKNRLIPNTKELNKFKIVKKEVREIINAIC